MAAISLCMNVRNEERNIRRCLESARQFADEMIVIDAGSTDRAKAVCENLAPRHIHNKATNLPTDKTLIL